VAKFLTQLDAKCITDGAWCLDTPLRYASDIFKQIIEVPAGFETDFASVPRVPIAFMFFGDRAHREAVLHDYLYRSDSVPLASYSQANETFLEAMKVTGKGWGVRYAMYWGVVMGGWTAYHKKMVGDKL
jgi:hypothetical protein